MAPANSSLLDVLRQAHDPAFELDEQLQAVDSTVRTAEEAEAVCELLKSLPFDSEQADGAISRLNTLLGLFQSVETEQAFGVLCAAGIPELCRIVDQLEATVDEESQDELLFPLKILAMYRTAEGTERVIRAARRPISADDYLWSVILGIYDGQHPHTPALVAALRDPLPTDFLRVAVLDCANRFALSGGPIDHPFDSAEGTQQLEQWLTSSDEDEFSYAHSATASLPFLTSSKRDELLALALDHQSVDVQMEAAWAAVKLGRESGAKLLSRWSLDPRYSRQACAYLDELGLEHAVADEARDPDFAAMAEMCQWLAHPSEYGRPPDSIEQYDTRRLFWPPTNDERQVWLFKYRYEPAPEDDAEDVGLGMIGSITFALFGETKEDLSPIEAYALHCCWELECHDDPRAPEERSIAHGLRILRETNPDLDAR